MNRYDYGKQFTDEEKLSYFERKRNEAYEKKDGIKATHYNACLFNLRVRMKRDKEKADEMERERKRKALLRNDDYDGFPF